MKKLMEMVQGKKTYITCIAMVLFAVIGVILNKVTMDDAMRMILEAAAIAGLRNAK